MSIDWITVIAQIANFLVLVWLLKRFLYRPILDGIDAREAEISRRMDDAREAKKKANVAALEFKNQQQKLLAEQEELVNQALMASQSQRDKLLMDARATLEQERKDWHRQQQRENQKFVTALHRAGAETLLELARKMLRDLADQTLEEAIIRHVGARLQSMAEDLSSASGGSKVAEATTHERLSDAAQEQLRVEVEHLLPGISLRFETDSKQAPGLVLRIGGAQLAWTIDSYTEELDALLRERIAVSVSDRGLGNVS